MTRPIITALHIHPVKSCGAVSLTSARLGIRGLDGDREWMVVRPDGAFVTQREHPEMARIAVRWDGDTVELTYPGRPSLNLSRAWNPDSGRACTVKVWRDSCPARDEGDSVAAWFSEILRAPLRLVRFEPGHRRLSAMDWTAGVDAENRFSDGFPVLVLGEETLEELNLRLVHSGAEPVPMDRFRPNVVIRGLGAGGEDRIRELAWGDLRLRLVKPCARCPIITTDQQTAEVGVEPLRTLATYRRHPRVSGVVFGQNAICVGADGGMLRVGDVGTVVG